MWEPWNLLVTQHAIERYRERTSGPSMSEAKAALKIRAIVLDGEEMVLRNKIESVKQLLAHDLEDARYFKLGAFMAVVANNMIKTVHLAEANKWTKKQSKKA